MSRLLSEDLLLVAQALHNEHKRRVYFYIPESYVVERSNLRFSHMYIYEKGDNQYHLPIYTFNNKLYIHSALVHPLGDGHKVGPSDITNAHFYPPEE